MIKHGSEIPPDYTLSRVTSRVILHYSDNDWLSSPIDVDRLYGKLPNVQRNHVPDKRYEFILAVEINNSINSIAMFILNLLDSSTWILYGELVQKKFCTNQ